jgi:WD40 repeat protein
MCDQERLAQLVQDARRFIMYHKGAIEGCPLQTYASALLFSPTGSLVRQLFQHEEPEAISIRPALSDEWSACLQTLEGHSSYVSSVTFSPDSTRLASASYDRTVKIWDASSGACLQTLEDHSDWVSSVAFSPDSTRLASASHDRTVKIWDASSGTCVHTLKDHSNVVTSVAFSHDSTRLASASYDRTVKIWDASSGACVHTLKGHSDWVSSVAFSHDSTRLASASYDSTVKIWDASSGACVQTLNVGRCLHDLSFAPDGSRLYTEIGSFEIQSLETSSITDLAEPARPLYVGPGFSLDGVWVQHAGSNVLWVPSEYRPLHSSVSGTMVGVGVGSGRVWICSIDP